MAGAMFLCGPLSGYIVSRRGPRISLLLGGFSLSIATIVFATSGASLANSKLFMGYLLIGIGLGFMNAAITNTAVSGMPRSQSGVASATTSTTRQIGQTLGVAIIGSVLASSLKNITDGASFTSAFHICWWIIFSFGLAVILTALITTGKWGAKTAVRFTRSITREEHQSLQPISS
jgi:MFS family permease